MDYQLPRDEKLYVSCRVVALGVLAGLVYFGVLKLPMDSSSFVLLTAAWIFLSAGLVLWLPMFSSCLIFICHAVDMVLVGFLVWNNGGNNCPVAYILPLYVITLALFVGKGYAVFTALAVAAFHIYLAQAVHASAFIYSAFWVAYCGGVLSFTFALAGVRDVRHYKLICLETEKREKFLERKLTKLEEKIDSQTIIDAVTGLKNFRYFRERIDVEIKRAARQKYIFSLCVMSVDGLDRFEKSAVAERDMVLASVTRQLIKSLRDTDLLARFQSNHFMFLLPDTDPRKAIIPSKRIRDKLLATGFGHGAVDRFNFSFGIVGFPMDANSVGGLISLATATLERSHQRGESQITLASSITRTLT